MNNKKHTITDNIKQAHEHNKKKQLPPPTILQSFQMYLSINVSDAVYNYYIQ